MPGCSVCRCPSLFSHRPEPGDALSQVVALLHPRAVFANAIGGKGDWAVRFAAYGRPSFCIFLEGTCRLAVDGHEPVEVGAGDFVLLPRTPAFTLAGGDAVAPVAMDPDALPTGGRELRYGDPSGPPDMRSLGGAFVFDRADPALLVALLPGVVCVRGSSRLSALVRMVAEESAVPRPGGDFVRARLVELLLVEALRATAPDQAPPGLLRGLGDARLAVALEQLHAGIDQPWTVERLARAAALSRSSFYERFTRAVGIAPMEYLLAWRMEIARDLLRQGELRTAEIAERVGYGSASAFSVAFTRHVGQTPTAYARAARGVAEAPGADVAKQDSGSDS